MDWLWNLLIWIVLGAVAGWLAGLIMGNRGGLLMNIIVGIIGAVIGGWVMGFFFGEPGATGLNIWSIVVAVVGAIILLAVVNLVSGRGVRA
jgi:uncharacterized membrane protein YeaQ/YmgE (transglycosylase-associated protein family)